MKKLNFILLIISIIIYLVIKSQNIDGDKAYESLFQYINGFDTFIPFTIGQGYPSIPLWLHYVFSNKLGLNYNISHSILGITYIFNVLSLISNAETNLSRKNKIIFKLTFIVFFIFGEFGLTLILSAEKMLLALIFFILAIKSHLKNMNKLKYFYYILSLSTHLTMIITIFLLDYKLINKIISKFLQDLSQLKVKVFSLFTLLVISIIGFISLDTITTKLFGLLRNADGLLSNKDVIKGEGTGNLSYLLITTCVFLLFYIMTKLNLKNIYLSLITMIPVFIRIPLGRIAWLYTFALFITPIFDTKKIYNENIFIIFSSLITIYYLYKSLIIFQNNCLFC